MSLMFQPLKKYADFSGRARRSEFWLFSLFILVVEIVYCVLIRVTGLDPSHYGTVNGVGMVLTGLLMIFLLAIIVPSLAVTFRRLHDTNRSAWWLLIVFLPAIGSLVLFVFYLLPGTAGANRFGPDPKGSEIAGAAAAFS